MKAALWAAVEGVEALADKRALMGRLVKSWYNQSRKPSVVLVSHAYPALHFGYWCVEAAMVCCSASTMLIP